MKKMIGLIVIILLLSMNLMIVCAATPYEEQKIGETETVLEVIAIATLGIALHHPINIGLMIRVIIGKMAAIVWGQDLGQEIVLYIKQLLMARLA